MTVQIDGAARRQVAQADFIVAIEFERTGGHADIPACRRRGAPQRQSTALYSKFVGVEMIVTGERQVFVTGFIHFAIPVLRNVCCKHRVIKRRKIEKAVGFHHQIAGKGRGIAKKGYALLTRNIQLSAARYCTVNT